MEVAGIRKGNKIVTLLTVFVFFLFLFFVYFWANKYKEFLLPRKESFLTHCLLNTFIQIYIFCECLSEIYFLRNNHVIEITIMFFLSLQWLPMRFIIMLKHVEQT